MAGQKTDLKTGLSELHLPEKTISFILMLEQSFPEISFRLSGRFRYHAPNCVFLGPADPDYALLALHELGHALCRHKDYRTDVQRLKIESEAWEKARDLCRRHPEWAEKYGVVWDDDFAEDQLDSYRDWLHSRSVCRRCGLTRFETPDGRWHCPNCDH